MASETLTHIGPDGRARMVDVGDKPQSLRTATAEGFVRAKPATIALVRDGKAKKGDVLTVAELAGIMGAKKTADLIPLCHPLPLSSVKVRIEIEETGFRVTAETRTTGQTGVEMEALTAVSTSALTVYDMLKAVDKAMVIERIQLLEKTGGVSGDFRREN